jgi:hypothetical protein
MSARYVATAIVVAAFVSAAATQARVAESRCETAGKTVRATDVARVFTTRRGDILIYHGCFVIQDASSASDGLELATSTWIIPDLLGGISRVSTGTSASTIL